MKVRKTRIKSMGMSLLLPNLLQLRHIVIFEVWYLLPILDLCITGTGGLIFITMDISYFAQFEAIANG
ncbi:MAG: hypothetical protein KA802_17060 [Saprospiraceae bacterium]|nr:hypothetical protein [Saprospiraceae bacterium]